MSPKIDMILFAVMCLCGCGVLSIVLGLGSLLWWMVAL